MSEIDGMSFDEWLDQEKRALAADEAQPAPARRASAHAAPESTARVAPRQDRRAGPPERPVVRVQRESAQPSVQPSLWDRWKILLITLTVLLLAAVMVLGAGFVYAGKVAKITTIYPNVTVNGVSVGGMTVAQAAAVLGDDPAKYDNAAVTVRFSTGESVTVTAQQLGLKPVDGTAYAQAAYDYGREGSLLANMKDYLYCNRNTLNMQVAPAGGPSVDEAAIEALVAPVAQQVDQKLAATQAQIDEEKITLVKDAAGQTVDVAAVSEMIRTAFEQENYVDIDYDAVQQGQQQGEAVNVDAMLQQLYDKVFVATADAMYDPVTGGVTESVTGVRFDMDEARRLWDEAAPGQNVVISLIREQPAVTSEQLSAKLFADVLAEKSTSLAGSTSARINNITLAAAAMNGVVLQPGQEFDYNACLGERTAAKGYQSAGAFANGQHVMSIGGGICQGSSTLYYCALKANLAITERWCHQFVVGYLPRGMDATVSWGFPGFRFVNSRSWPIRIEASVSGGYLNIRLVGTDEDGSYVDITNETWEDEAHYYAQTWRNVYDANGNLISSTKEAYSSYDKEEALATPTPEPTQAPEVLQDVYVPPADMAPEYVPEPEPVPEVVPEVIPEVVPETVPEVIPETVPETQPLAEAPPADVPVDIPPDPLAGV